MKTFHVYCCRRRSGRCEVRAYAGPQYRGPTHRFCARVTAPTRHFAEEVVRTLGWKKRNLAADLAALGL